MSINKQNNQKLIKTSYENFPLWSSLYLRNLMPDLSTIYYFYTESMDESNTNHVKLFNHQVVCTNE